MAVWRRGRDRLNEKKAEGNGVRVEERGLQREGE